MLKNKNKLIQIVLACVFCFSFSLAPLLARQVSAQNVPTGGTQNTECGSPSIPSYNASYTAKPDTYDVYARLGRTEQTAAAKLYFQVFGSGICQKLGTTTINGKKWTRVAVFKETKNDDFGIFTLESGAIDSLPDANRPTIMLVSQKDPVCHPTTECFVKVGGRQGIVRPTGTLLNEDSLHVVAVTDPSSDTVGSVDYYVDDVSAYSKPTLESFNLRYVGAGKHKLTTVVTYKSGQKVIFSQSVDRGFTDEINYLFFGFVYGQSTLLKIVGTLLLLLLVAVTTLSIIRTVHKRRLWKKHHFLEQNAPAPTTLPATPGAPPEVAPLHIEKPDSRLLRVTRWVIPTMLILATALSLIIVLNAYILQLFTVDGPSMNSTLATGQQLIVDKLPQTWAKMTGKDYVPKRGNVIVFKKAVSPVYGDFGDSSEYVVKRVIGLPGERVTVKKGKVTVYNSEHPHGFNPDTGSKWSSTYHLSEYDNIDIKVEPGQIFVMGDNRPESIDSRSFGSIQSKNIVGRAGLRISPWTKL